MQNNFKNELGFDFGTVSMRNRRLSDQTKVENKMVKKLTKHNFKYSRKIENDIETIKGLVREIGEGEEMKLLSKSFDSPNIVLSFLENIETLYIATWAITPAGINALVEICKQQTKEVFLLLDKTHSYKWIFTSNAYEILKGKVKIKFALNHSKFICFKLKSGKTINFVGSMNFSNNPRFENIDINKDPDDFEFYKTFIKTVGGQTL